MVETENKVKTYTTQQDFFAGYTPIQPTTDRILQPEFKPFNYSAEIPTTEYPNVTPSFEVEKQYTFDTTPYEETQKASYQTMEMPSLQRREYNEDIEIVANQRRVTSSKAKLNARGKIAITVYSIVVAIIVALCVYNSIAINGLSSEIASKAQIVATQTEVINQLQDTYDSLGEDETILSKVEGEFKVPTADDVVYIDDFVMLERPTYKEETNWFEEFCKKLRKLFS